MKKIVEIGPWGGRGGRAWDDGSHDGIREIFVVHGDCIDSITVVYDKHGTPFTAPKHGGVGGVKTAQVQLQFPEEYLSYVSGYYGEHNGSLVIRSLTFKTNRGTTYGAFGVEEGTPFSLPVAGGMIVGFKGRSGWYVDSIGCHVARLSSSTSANCAFKGKLKKFFTTVFKG